MEKRYFEDNTGTIVVLMMNVSSRQTCKKNKFWEKSNESRRRNISWKNRDLEGWKAHIALITYDMVVVGTVYIRQLIYRMGNVFHGSDIF